MLVLLDERGVVVHVHLRVTPQPLGPKILELREIERRLTGTGRRAEFRERGGAPQPQSDQRRAAVKVQAAHRGSRQPDHPPVDGNMS